jgi:hypothetical protein
MTAAASSSEQESDEAEPVDVEAPLDEEQEREWIETWERILP